MWPEPHCRRRFRKRRGAFHTPFLSGLSSNMYIFPKLNPTGSSLVYSALIGGAAPETGIAVDNLGKCVRSGIRGLAFPP